MELIRHPKDKDPVENTVKLLYPSVYLDIERMTFFSLDGFNTAIRISLLDFNEKVMVGRRIWVRYTSPERFFLQK